MIEPTYRDAIMHAYQTVKRHKNLWFFGLFATFVGQMGLMEMVAHIFAVEKQFIYYPSLFNLKVYLYTLLNGLSGAGFGPDQWIWLIWLVIFFVAFALLLACLAVLSQGALVHGISQTFSLRRHSRPVDTTKAWRAGVKHFWRLLALNILKKVFLSGLVFLLAFATWNAVLYVRSFDVILFLIAFVLAIVIGTILSFLLVYAVGYVVIEEYTLPDALYEAYRLFRDHWLVSLEIAVIALLANVVSAALVFVGLVFFVAELALVWILKLVLASTFVWQVGLFVGTFVFAAYIIFIGITLTIFTTALWTYLFVKMHRHGVASRVLHFLGHRPK